MHDICLVECRGGRTLVFVSLYRVTVSWQFSLLDLPTRPAAREQQYSRAERRGEEIPQTAAGVRVRGFATESRWAARGMKLGCGASNCRRVQLFALCSRAGFAIRGSLRAPPRAGAIRTRSARCDIV